MRPMLATKGDVVPTGDEWSHEVKWDGVRMLADVVDGADRARLTTRNGNDATLAWPDVSLAPMGGRDLLVDGEIIGLNDEADEKQEREARRKAEREAKRQAERDRLARLGY